MITYPLNIPLEAYASISFEGDNIVGATRSQFTLKGQVQEFEGSIWQATVNYPELDVATAQPIAGFLMSLRGRLGSFLLGNPAQPNPQGAASTTASSPVVDGAAQTGFELLVRSAPSSLVDWLKVGDYIQIGPSSRARLHILTDDATTAADGTATLDIWPALREPTLDGDVVIYNSARGVFRLDTNRPGFDIRAPFRYQIGFPAVQV